MTLVLWIGSIPDILKPEKSTHVAVHLKTALRSVDVGGYFLIFRINFLY